MVVGSIEKFNKAIESRTIPPFVGTRTTTEEEKEEEEETCKKFQSSVCTSTKEKGGKFDSLSKRGRNYSSWYLFPRFFSRVKRDHWISIGTRGCVSFKNRSPISLEARTKVSESNESRAKREISRITMNRQLCVRAIVIIECPPVAVCDKIRLILFSSLFMPQFT